MSPTLIFLEFRTHSYFTIQLMRSFILRLGCHGRSLENFSPRKVFWDFLTKPLSLWVKGTECAMKKGIDQERPHRWVRRMTHSRLQVDDPWIQESSYIPALSLPCSQVTCCPEGSRKKQATSSWRYTFHSAPWCPGNSCGSHHPGIFGPLPALGGPSAKCQNNWTSITALLWRLMEMTPTKGLAHGLLLSTR